MSEFKLNNSAECLGYLCCFVACSDGELHKDEVKRTIGHMGMMMTQLEIDSDGDGDVDADDIIKSFTNVMTQMPGDFETAARNFVGICCDYFGEWSDNNKAIIVNSLADVAKADNVIQDVEKTNVNLVAEIFGVDKPF